MSVEEDIDTVETELKELLTETLEENGLLAKIRVCIPFYTSTIKFYCFINV